MPRILQSLVALGQGIIESAVYSRQTTVYRVKQGEAQVRVPRDYCKKAAATAPKERLATYIEES